MKKLDLSGLTRTFNKVGFKLKKHSPEILVGVGIIGTITSSVMACKATIKAGSIIEEHKELMESRHKASELAANHELTDKDGEVISYTDEDFKKDTAIIYTKTAVKFVKLYAPSVVLGTLSIASILSGHNIIRKRNVALAAAYATVDKGFKEYRGRVIERFGKELDKELKYNIKAKEFEEIIVDEKTGKEKAVKNTVNVCNPNEYSDYARFFDDGCNGWTKDPELNLLFLRKQQDSANDLLKLRGYLFLNEVYEMLGIPRSKAGQIVGWVYDEENPIGDNYVDFGMYDSNREAVRNFVNGYERTILLDFNVDGNILDLM